MSDTESGSIHDSQVHLSNRVGKNRILSVDSMRGVAMILVIMQHAYHLIDESQVDVIANYAIYSVTRMASVAFMSISGMMIGYFVFYRPDWKRVHMRFVRRAIFLLLIVHTGVPLIRYFYYEQDRWQHFLRSILFEYQITDTIALSLIIAPLLLIKLKSRTRVTLILVSLLISPLLNTHLESSSAIVNSLKVIFFGTIGNESRLLISWPLMPWLAIFLIGAILGETLASVKKGEISVSTLVTRMRRSAVVLTVVGIILTVGYKLLKTHFAGDLNPRFFLAIYPSRTTSLLPIYLAILLWIFSFLMVRIDTRHRYDRLAWLTSVFGRTSLFTYITQFAVVHTTPALFGLKGHLNLWQFALLFIVGLTVTWLISYAYGRWRGWITVDDYMRIRRIDS